MRSLFLKIFLSYWVAQALFFLLAIAITLAMRPPGEIANAQAQEPRVLDEAVEAYKSGGADALRKYMHGAHDTIHARLFLFDEQGHDLMGRRPPEWIEKVRTGRIHTADSFWGRFGELQFLRDSETASDGHVYTMVVELPPAPHAIFGPNGVPGLGILIGVISSGLVCYFLARYLTSPIVRLRAATQKLAAGDLTARAGSSELRRHDEVSELVRDFDAMAERIENLLTSQHRLLTDISHELRSPLARLSLALELARQRSSPEAGSALDRIERESIRLNGLIQSLLTVARLESGEDLRRQVDLDQLVQEIAKDASFEAQGRGSKVRLTAAGRCLVNGDPSLLHSAIENVVRNAVRYTEPGTDVEIQLAPEESSVRREAVIRVSDSGPGVPQDSLDKIFRPFYRIDDARGRQTGGVGLGLAITERAVRMHGGTVTASNRPQGGLAVEIRFPLAAFEQIAPEKPAATVVG